MIYETNGESHEILEGSVGTLSCSITGVSNIETKITMQWINEKSEVYDESSQNTDYKVNVQILVGEGKISTLTLSEKKTAKGDQIYTCRVIVGAQTEPFDLEIPLRTFDIRTEGADVELGQTATLTCSVTGPSGTLTISWIHYGDVVGIPKVTESHKTTVSELVLEEALYDKTYTCRVTGQNTYTLEVQLVVNDIFLEPSGRARVFSGTHIHLICAFKTLTISEGSFQWSLDGQSCTSDDCQNTKDSPKSSTLTITVSDNTAGQWKCSFIKTKNRRKISSTPLELVEVRTRGEQTPAAVWGRIGDEATVSCVVPVRLSYSNLTVIEWKVNGHLITEATLNAENGASLITFSDKTESATDLTWTITFTHSTVTQGALQCKVAYTSKKEVTIPSTRVNLITVTSDPDPQIMTPNSGAEVTFITQAEHMPTTSVFISNRAYSVQSSKQETGSVGGIVFTEVILFASNQLFSANGEDELAMQVFPYSYTVNTDSSNEISITGNVFLVGQTFVESSPVWGAIGGRAKLTAYLTAMEISSVKVIWQHKTSKDSNGWTDISSDVSSATIISKLNDKNVMSTILVINKLRESDITQYRAKVELALAGSQQITKFEEITTAKTIKAAYCIAQDVEPIFERGDVLLKVTIDGPGDLTSVTLVHKESGRESQVKSPDNQTSNPIEISHQIMNVYSSNEGLYFFKVRFARGLKLQSKPVKLAVKKKCRPFTPPPNTGELHFTNGKCFISFWFYFITFVSDMDSCHIP